MKQYQEDHKYERELRLKGYELILVFSDNPHTSDKGFEKYRPNSFKGWDWRRAIELFLKNHPLFVENKNFKIIKGVGYWRDLHNIVYEVWTRSNKKPPSL